MIINGLEKLSLVDFDEHLCCTTFSSGCNFRCPFCHNSPLVLDVKNQPLIDEDEILKFLKKRKGILDGVCISGGEPTLQKDLKTFLKKIKELGYLTKLDTNGSNPDLLQELIDEGLIDYIAMDIKSSPEGYSLAVGIENFNLTSVKKSIEILKSNNLPYEFRTTIINELHTEKDIVEIGKWLKGSKKYFLQKFKDTGSCIQQNLTEVDKSTAEKWKSILSKDIEKVILRGYD